MIRMVVFDMAGTTINEDNVVYKTLQRAINDHGYFFTLDQVMAAGAGKEKSEAIKSILKLKNKNDDEWSEEIYKHFIILLREAYSYLKVKPQPNCGGTVSGAETTKYRRGFEYRLRFRNGKYTDRKTGLDKRRNL